MITKAQPGDAEAILSLINYHAESNLMLPRTLADIERNLPQFLVYRESGGILGVCALCYGAEGLVEIRSLAVHSNHYRKSIGTVLVDAAMQEAARAGYARVFVLTYVAPLFQRFGFEVIDKKYLPEKIWRDCQVCPKQECCDETAMIRNLVPAETVAVELPVAAATQAFAAS
jgi:amino-acid N-acetyltransferase